MDFDVTVAVRRPPSTVFRFLSELQEFHDADARSLVPVYEKSPPGPTTIGTSWREVVRLGPGLRMLIVSTVIAIEPDRLLDMRFRSWWMRGRLAYLITPTADGCTLRQRERLLPRGPFRWFDGRIAAMLGPKVSWRLEAIRDKLDAGVADGSLPGAAADASGAPTSVAGAPS